MLWPLSSWTLWWTSLLQVRKIICWHTSWYPLKLPWCLTLQNIFSWKIFCQKKKKLILHNTFLKVSLVAAKYAVGRKYLVLRQSVKPWCCSILWELRPRWFMEQCICISLIFPRENEALWPVIIQFSKIWNIFRV